MGRETTDSKRREYNIQYFRERYEWRKSNGMCVNCGKERADYGHVLCLMCRMDTNERSNEIRRNCDFETREKNNMKIADYHRKKYKERAEKGQCVRCGKRAARNNYKTCDVCRAKTRTYRREWRNKKGITPRILMGNGEYCWFCGKPGCNGKKTCPECRERQAAIITQAGHSPEKDHPWRNRITEPERCNADEKGKVENG